VHSAGTKVPEPMNMQETEDLTREKLSWLIGHVDEMFLDLEESENET
jgi:hypothetical protein